MGVNANSLIVFNRLATGVERFELGSQNRASYFVVVVVVLTTLAALTVVVVLTTLSKDVTLDGVCLGRERARSGA